MSDDSDRRAYRTLGLLRRLSGVVLALSLLDYLAITFVAEDAWFTMLLTHLPQLPWMLVCVVLIVIAAVKKQRVALMLAALALGVRVHLDNPGTHVVIGEPRGADQAASMRILTYNLQEGKEDPIVIRDTIKAADPDVCAFQEAAFLGSESNASRPLLEFFKVKRYHVHRERGLAIASRWPIKRVWTPEFQVPTHAWALFAEIESEYRGTFLFASVHLNPVHWDRFLFSAIGKMPDHLRSTARVRERQVQSLLDEVNRLLTGPAFFVCGDFNGPPRGKLYDRLADRMLDAYGTSGFGFGWTIPSRAPMFRLDYIFTHPNRRVRSVQVNNDEGSDHLPLAADVQ